AGAASIATVAVVDRSSVHAQDATPAATPAVPGHAEMPGAGTSDRPDQFFNIHEAETVDAIVSRILPGTADDPGAHEAGVVFYIDGKLGGTNLGYSLKTYQQGPFPVVSETPVTVEAASSRDIYDYVTVPAEQIS